MGLLLNAERLRLRVSTAISDGVEAALSRGKLSVDWYDALCLLPEYIRHVQYHRNAAKMEATILKQGGHPCPI